MYVYLMSVLDTTPPPSPPGSLVDATLMPMHDGNSQTIIVVSNAADQCWTDLVPGWSVCHCAYQRISQPECDSALERCCQQPADEWSLLSGPGMQLPACCAGTAITTGADVQSGFVQLLADILQPLLPHTDLR